MTATETAPLLGRDRELAELDALVTRARTGSSGALVLGGEAGVGKTMLLQRVTQRLPATVHVVRMVAAEAEMELPYAGLQLLCGPMMDAARHLPGSTTRALEGGASASGRPPRPTPSSSASRCSACSTEAAGERPLLCVVDDAQWLDEASARGHRVRRPPPRG